MDNIKLTKDQLYTLELNKLLLVNNKAKLTYNNTSIIGFKNN